MGKRKQVLRWFWAWNDEREEQWLEAMARRGWHLVSGPLVYGFEQGAPAEVRYRLDYRNESKGLDDYVKLCKEAGWERVFQYAGWQYFRTASAEAPEFYTDAPSRIAKYQRLFSFVLAVALATTVAQVPMLMRAPDNPQDLHLHLFIRWIVLGLMAAWVVILARLGLGIRKMKRQLR
ncbi:MAG TPA: DUF2812 domain-containing protein [Terracidiphilus sp.]|jgi:hypothetical protein|nr:DUF2812 domain-containing protein [Terracidiphilus sp.]